MNGMGDPADLELELGDLLLLRARGGGAVFVLAGGSPVRGQLGGPGGSLGWGLGGMGLGRPCACGRSVEEELPLAEGGRGVVGRSGLWPRPPRGAAPPPLHHGIGVLETRTRELIH